MADDFQMAKNAAGQAFARVQKAFNIETDPDIRFYDRLTDDDFALIRETYGDEGLSQYISTMEQKKIRRS